MLKGGLTVEFGWLEIENRNHLAAKEYLRVPTCLEAEQPADLGETQQTLLVALDGEVLPKMRG